MKRATFIKTVVLGAFAVIGLKVKSEGIYKEFDPEKHVVSWAFNLSESTPGLMIWGKSDNDELWALHRVEPSA